MLVLKGCPRCHGDLLLTTYMDDRSTNCLQCGFSRQLPPPARKPEPLPVRGPERSVRLPVRLLRVRLLDPPHLDSPQRHRLPPPPDFLASAPKH